MKTIINIETRVAMLKPRVVEVLSDGTEIVVYEPTAPAEIYEIDSP